MQHVLSAFRDRFGFPDSYMVFDVETLGFSMQYPVLQVGWALVIKTQLADASQFTLDWTRDGYGINVAQFERDLANHAEHMEKQGACAVTPERMRAEGGDPHECLATYFDIINSYLESGCALVGHNAAAFDKPRLSKTLKHMFDEEPAWNSDSIIDTGAIERACQMDEKPSASESLEEWNLRMLRRGPRGIKWSLAGHCCPKYHIARRCGVDLSTAHTAETDCIITHCLFETYREILEGIYDPNKESPIAAYIAGQSQH